MSGAPKRDPITLDKFLTKQLFPFLGKLVKFLDKVAIFAIVLGMLGYLIVEFQKDLAGFEFKLPNFSPIDATKFLNP